MAITRTFDVFDYLVFVATLLISVLIGVFFAFRGHKTTEDFHLGGRKMPVIPTALSLLASFQSGILILGISSEMYMRGIVYFWYTVGILFGLPLAALVYLPVFYKLKLISSYEYLELRFKSKALRYFGSINFAFSTIMYMAIVLYAPATALSAVTNFSEDSLILITGAVCTFYTTIGGLKAVVWTDTFQTAVMYAGLVAIVIQGVLDVGGVEKVYNIAFSSGRLFTDFSDANPFTYMNFWSIVWGNALGWMTIYGTNQASIQRYVSLSSLGKAQASLLLCLPGMLTMIPLVCICGIVMYAYYANCDPLSLNLIANRDQLLPHFNMEVLGHMRGMPGLFVACLFSGTLSKTKNTANEFTTFRVLVSPLQIVVLMYYVKTYNEYQKRISTGLSSLAAVTWEDYLKKYYGNSVSPSRATLINKLLAVVFGVISMSFAFLPRYLGGVFETGLTVLSMIGGPLAGLFLLGILQPWADKYGATAGVFVSSVLMVWIAVGAQVVKPYRFNLPRTVTGCSNETLAQAGFYGPNFPNITATAALEVDPELTGFQYMYKLSYTLYGLTAILLVLIVGSIVSYFTAGTSLKDTDSNLIWPGYYHICCCLPPAVRKRLVPSKESIRTKPALYSSYSNVNSRKERKTENIHCEEQSHKLLHQDEVSNNVEP